MNLPNKLYDIAKYAAQVGLPALATLVASLGAIWNWQDTDSIVKTIVAVNVALGALLVLNQAAWNRSDAKYDGVALVQETPPGQDNVITDLNLNKTAEEVSGQKDLVLKVENVPMAG